MYIAHSYVQDVTTPLQVWHEYLFAGYCSMSVLSAAARPPAGIPRPPAGLIPRPRPPTRQPASLTACPAARPSARCAPRSAKRDSGARRKDTLIRQR